LPIFTVHVDIDMSDIIPTLGLLRIRSSRPRDSRYYSLAYSRIHQSMDRHYSVAIS
jgi:hypothetical protein